MKRKTPLYYPEKTDDGFKVVKTYVPEKELGFAAFKTKRVAEASGERWYGKQNHKMKKVS
jgi:hypothetical protein